MLIKINFINQHSKTVFGHRFYAKLPRNFEQESFRLKIHCSTLPINVSHQRAAVTLLQITLMWLKYSEAALAYVVDTLMLAIQYK